MGRESRATTQPGAFGSVVLTLCAAMGGCGAPASESVGRLDSPAQATSRTASADSPVVSSDSADTVRVENGAITIASGPEWISYAENADGSRGPSLGRAKYVCGGPGIQCPPGAVSYNFGAYSQPDTTTIPTAHWIWRGDVATEDPAGPSVIFEKTYVLGPNSSGWIKIAADDFAEVRMNGVRLASIGSTADIGAALRSQKTLTHVDLTTSLREGPNTLTILGRNGPWACQPRRPYHCPASVLFGGVIRSCAAGQHFEEGNGCAADRGPSDLASARVQKPLPSSAPETPYRPAQAPVAPHAPPQAASTQAPSTSDRSPVVGAPQRTAYALVIGIESYRDLPPATGARKDAEAFANMLRQTMAIPQANIHVALNDRATRSDLERQLAWIQTAVPPGGRAYLYFSGHGSPQDNDGSPFLVPYDASPDAVSASSIAVSYAAETLNRSHAHEALVVLDACFSGVGGRSVLPKGARPLVRVREVDTPPRLAIFAAASGSEISGLSAEGTSGLFTKYVLDGIATGQADIDGDGQLTLQELSDWVTPRVSREAIRIQRNQTPHLAVGQDLGDARNIAVVWGIK